MDVTVDTAARFPWILLLALGISSCQLDRSPPPSFIEVSSSLGLSREPAEYGPLWADLNGDGWLDLVFMNHGVPSLYVNSGAGSAFVDKAAGSGIRLSDWEYDQQGDRHGGSCADYDNDGDADLFVSHGAKRGETLGVKYDELLNNQGDGTFTEVSLEAGATNRQGRGRTGNWADYDGDGRLDLYAGNYESPNVLYRGLRDGTFRDMTAEAGLAGVTGPRVAWADLDDDGAPDLLVGWPLRVFRGRPGGVFEEVTAAVGLDSQHIFPYSMALGDADADGDLDLFIGSKTTEGNLYLNDSGVFRRGPGLAAGEEGEGAGAALGDLDNDGDLDLVRAGTKGLRLFVARGGLQFEAFDLWRAPAPLEAGGGVTLGDYDGDGYLDIAFDSAGGQGLLRNSGGANSWLQLVLAGSRSNRSGFGAKVWVRPRSGRLQGQTLYRQYWGDDAAFRSRGCGPVHVGLADAESVDLRVLWPSGRETVRSDVPVNQTLRIGEPEQD